MTLRHLWSSHTSISLEQQRKRAKDLRRAHHEGSIEAAVRIARHLPRARNQAPDDVFRSGVTLSECQLVVAREAGFSSWPRMKRHVDEAARGRIDIIERILDAALSGDADLVDTLVASGPAAVHRSVHAAAVLADSREASALLDADASLADRRGGRRNWPPLLYLCCSRYRQGEPEAAAARRRIARRLLDLGADVSASGREPGYTSANVTVFDEHEWTPIEAAAIRTADPGLGKMLLDAGADLEKTSAVLTHAVSGGSVEVLRLLLDRLPESIRWQSGWAAKAAVALGRPDMARMLATHNAPRMLEHALLDAIRLGRDAEFIGIFLVDDHHAPNTPVLRNAYRTATRFGHRAAAGLLRRHGVDDTVLTDVDRVIAAGINGEDAELRRLREGFPDVQAEFREDEHRMLAWAIRTHRYDAVPLLLDAGLDPDIPDKDGETPLHLAVGGNSLETIEALLRAGAVVDARNFNGNTPLDLAIAHANGKAREPLARRLLDAGARPAADEPSLDKEEMDILFERAADAVASGELETLRELLDTEPFLVHARSPRPHRATLLTYCGSNGVEDERQRVPVNGAEVMRLLVDRGADVNATCNLYGGGATTLYLHLTSGHPVRAGLRTTLTEILLNAGAIVEGARGAGGIVGAAALGRIERVRSFFKTDGTLGSNTTRSQVQSAFMWACEFGRTNVVRFLLEKGPDLHAQNPDGQTALHLTALGGHAEVVKLLLERKAPLEVRNVWGGTVLDNALWGTMNWDPRVDYTPVLEMLIRSGAVVRSEYRAWLEQDDRLSPSARARIQEILGFSPG